MSQATDEIMEPARPPSVFAGFLSYLIPGLGQIYQGRTGKGFLFMVCLLGMFIGGQYMGEWKNVYLPDLARGPDDINPWENNPWHMPKLLQPVANLYHRWHFAGQFWIGVAAWPALWQYNQLPVPSKETSPFWHNFQRGPRGREDEIAYNEYLTNSDKMPDVAWVYTVIAGVLNILVIYDAYAGPAYNLARRAQPTSPRPQEEVAAT
jgi:hypothetical protein